MVVEFNPVEELVAKVSKMACYGPGTFARVSYTNHAAHERQHTWYPVLSISECNCDFQFEPAYLA